MSAESKCNCQHCNGHISFPSEMAGQTTNCPHCQLETLLFIPPVAIPPRQNGTTSKGTGTTGFLFVGIALVIVVVIALVAGNIQKQSPAKPSNLKPAVSAFGWKLGDKLPEQLKTQLKDGNYHFNPEKVISPFNDYELSVTDDGRIYSIQATGYAPDAGENSETCKNALISLLTEKYGRQMERRDSFGVGENYFFGTDDQIAHLNIYNRDLFTLEYLDRNLRRTSYTEQEAKQKKAEEEKKAALSKGL